MPTTTRRRPTPHQAEVLARLVRRYDRTHRPIRADDIGSRTALEHLVRKGHLLRGPDLVGPRGGVTPTYEPAR